MYWLKTASVFCVVESREWDNYWRDYLEEISVASNEDCFNCSLYTFLNKWTVLLGHFLNISAADLVDDIIPYCDMSCRACC